MLTFYVTCHGMSVTVFTPESRPPSAFSTFVNMWRKKVCQDSCYEARVRFLRYKHISPIHGNMYWGLHKRRCNAKHSYTQKECHAWIFELQVTDALSSWKLLHWYDPSCFRLFRKFLLPNILRKPCQLHFFTGLKCYIFGHNWQSQLYRYLLPSWRSLTWA